MRLQLQRYRTPADGAYGDCQRTCIAMVLDMDRDDIPHFNQNITPGEPSWSWDSQRAREHQRQWLSDLGIVAVEMPVSGDSDVNVLIEQFACFGNELAVVLGCRRCEGCDHNVVLYDGRVYDPLGNDAPLKPMLDGMWWITIYAHATKPLQEVAQPASVVSTGADLDGH